MPNWVEQNLHIVGSKSDIDRLIRSGFRRHHKEQFDDLLDFRALCPPKRKEPKSIYTPDTGVVQINYRTRTQACFAMVTAWDYPSEFYARLVHHWSTLAFVCSVNGEMGDFGGVVMAMDGEFVNQVRDYDADYDRAAHERDVRKVLKRWAAFLAGGRDWRTLPDAPWRHRTLATDAHFDDDFWFFFRSRAEMVKFRTRYRSVRPQRRVDDGWKRTHS